MKGGCVDDHVTELSIRANGEDRARQSSRQ